MTFFTNYGDMGCEFTLTLLKKNLNDPPLARGELKHAKEHDRSASHFKLQAVTPPPRMSLVFLMHSGVLSPDLRLACKTDTRGVGFRFDSVHRETWAALRILWLTVGGGGPTYRRMMCDDGHDGCRAGAPPAAGQARPFPPTGACSWRWLRQETNHSSDGAEP